MYSNVKPQMARNHSHLTYLEPPHLHDPSSVSDVASLPLSTLESLPKTLRPALYNLQQSTSIVYASVIRFQDLLQERFERLMPSMDDDGEVEFSEPSFENYAKTLCAERTYLLSDALPDWRHKASLARVAVQPYDHLPLNLGPSSSNSSISVSEWWQCLQSAVASWCDYARAVHIPDFEDTVGEYLAIQRQTPSLAVDLDETPLETPLDTLTPTWDHQSEHVRICDIKDRDFTSLTLDEAVMSTKASGLHLLNAAAIGGLARNVTQEYLLENDGEARDERKDSGVGIAH